MKTATPSMQAMLTASNATLATAWLIQRIDGTVFAFTDHDVSATINLEAIVSGYGYSNIPGIDGTGTQVYESLTGSGYAATDVENTAALNVDNMEVHGLLSSSSITEDDLRAGLWDYANVCIFVYNWNDPDGSPDYGAVIMRIGKLGEVTIDAGIFKAELRGLTQAYTRTIGELTSPLCRADLGDARCTVNLLVGSPSFTVTGSIAAVSSNGMTIYDPARTEAGPTGGIGITNVTNANPGVVHLASAVPFVAGQLVTISGVLGMTQINVTTTVFAPTGSQFSLGIDTSDTSIYLPYAGGGSVVALGSDSGFFDGGKITILNGANAGLFREVKSYVPGQITLQLPFPYDIDVGSPSTTYSMHVGCDKSMTTCRDRFNNLVNFRGEPYLPGVDKLVQVGRHNS
jgi:hypothetical protein